MAKKVIKSKDNTITDIVKDIVDGQPVEKYLNKKGEVVKVVIVKE